MLVKLPSVFTHETVICVSPAENNIHVHDLLTFQQITVLPKAKGATLFACDLQVGYRRVVFQAPLSYAYHIYDMTGISIASYSSKLADGLREKGQKLLYDHQPCLFVFYVPGSHFSFCN